MEWRILRCPPSRKSPLHCRCRVSSLGSAALRAKHEFYRGEIFAMAGATTAHNQNLWQHFAQSAPTARRPRLRTISAATSGCRIDAVRSLDLSRYFGRRAASCKSDDDRPSCGDESAGDLSKFSRNRQKTTIAGRNSSSTSNAVAAEYVVVSQDEGQSHPVRPQRRWNMALSPSSWASKQSLRVEQ